MFIDPHSRMFCAPGTITTRWRAPVWSQWSSRHSGSVSRAPIPAAIRIIWRLSSGFALTSCHLPNQPKLSGRDTRSSAVCASRRTVVIVDLAARRSCKGEDLLRYTSWLTPSICSVELLIAFFVISSCSIFVRDGLVSEHSRSRPSVSLSCNTVCAALCMFMPRPDFGVPIASAAQFPLPTFVVQGLDIVVNSTPSAAPVDV
jgi:hypothetical protein